MNRIAAIGLLCASVLIMVLFCVLFIMHGGSEDYLGTVHPTYPSMMMSSNVDTPTLLQFVQTALLITIVSMVGLILALPGPSYTTRSSQQVMLIMGGTYVVLFVVLIWLAGGNDQPSRLLGFPPATAWMLYAIGLFPIVIAGCILANYRKWVIGNDGQSAAPKPS